VQESVVANGAFVSLNGPVYGPIELDAEHVEVGANASLLGLVTVTSPQPPLVSSQALIREDIVHEYKDTIPKDAAKKSFFGLVNGMVAFVSLIVYWYIAMSIMGVLLIAILPKAVQAVRNNMTGKNSSKTWLTGIVVFFIAPLAMITLMVTLLGIPLAGVVLLLYIVSLLLAKLFVAMAVGRWIFRKTDRPYLGFLLGYGIVRLVTFIPILGWFMSCVIIVWGLGGLWYTIAQKRA
jgi:hypothetical protein